MDLNIPNLDAVKIFNNIDKLTDFSKKINPSLKKQFTQKIVRNFLKQRGVKMNDAYYKKMLKAVQNIMQSDIQMGGGHHYADSALVNFNLNIERGLRRNLMRVILSLAWYIVCFTSLILGINELLALTDYELLSANDRFTIQNDTTGELVVYDSNNQGAVVPLSELSTSNDNVAVIPSPQDIREALTIGQFLTLRPEVGQILLRRANSVITDVVQRRMNDLYDNVRRNSVETYNRARDVVNPVVLFNEDPVTWFSVGVGGLMNYLRYETNEEIVRLTQEMEDVYIDISRELDTFRINLMRNTNTEVRFIVRRIEIAINLIRFGGGALLSSLILYLRRIRNRRTTTLSLSNGGPSFEEMNGGKKRRRKTKKTKRKKRKTKRRKNKKRTKKI